MIKLLKVPQDHPFTWQLSLLDHEIGQILDKRFDVSLFNISS